MRDNSLYQPSKEDPRISTRVQKKSTGTFYTPEPLAKMIARDAIFAWLSQKSGTTILNLQHLGNLRRQQQKNLLSDIRGISILDPAVGNGVFLLAAGDWLLRIRVKLGDNESENEICSEIAMNCVFGVDLSKQAINDCTQRLADWSRMSSSSIPNITVGNSLVGLIKVNGKHGLDHDTLNIALARMMNPKRESQIIDELNEAEPLHWHSVYPSIFSASSPGFDIVLGNPPYGNILGPIERLCITRTYPVSVGGGREGTWNSAAHFLARSLLLMKQRGLLGFLVPNSFLRVKQFTKLRNHILNRTKLWKIIDEGSPFDDVTLEMVSLFCELTESEGNHKIKVESRRPGLEQSNSVSAMVFNDCKVFSLYYDHIWTQILKRGQRHLLVAGRGRDIPKEHVRRKRTETFEIPYLTSGRSVQRYGLDEKHVYYTDAWFLQDAELTNSFENEFLIATKNYRYPRCLLKPKGMIHGGGVVKITPLYKNADLRVLGLILNSSLVRKVSIRYLTNYSQLTCCLNTGIMEELPLILPKRPAAYRELFDLLSRFHSGHNGQHDTNLIPTIEKLADALVYSLYFRDDSLEKRVDRGYSDLLSTAQDPEVLEMIAEVFSVSSVMELERLGYFPSSRKLRRY